MTQEEKELLIKDLCARLPYGVKVKFYLPLNTHSVIETLRDVEIRNEDILICTTTWNAIKLEICKPYLRPMSSMTDEEQFQLGKLLGATSYNLLKGKYSSLKELLEYVYKNHIDLFDLIPKGLALEAPKDMYNTKTE